MDPQAGCESATWRRRSWESGRRSRQCSAAPRAAGRCTSGRDGEPYPLQMFSSSHKHFRQLLQIPACVSVSEQDWESMGSHRSPMPPPTTTSPPRHQGGTECSLHPHTHGAGGLLCPLACTRCHHQTQMLSQVLWGVLQLRSPEPAVTITQEQICPLHPQALSWDECLQQTCTICNMHDRPSSHILQRWGFKSKFRISTSWCWKSRRRNDMWKYFEIERFSIPHQFPVSKPQFQVCNRAKLAIFKLLKYCLRFRENPLFDNPDSLCAPLRFHQPWTTDKTFERVKTTVKCKNTLDFLVICRPTKRLMD